jgi:hypothetical protein
VVRWPYGCTLATAAELTHRSHTRSPCSPCSPVPPVPARSRQRRHHSHGCSCGEATRSIIVGRCLLRASTEHTRQRRRPQRRRGGLRHGSWLPCYSTSNASVCRAGKLLECSWELSYSPRPLPSPPTAGCSPGRLAAGVPAPARPAVVLGPPLSSFTHHPSSKSGLRRT